MYIWYHLNLELIAKFLLESLCDNGYLATYKLFNYTFVGSRDVNFVLYFKALVPHPFE